MFVAERFRTADDVADFLEKNFKHECIGPSESLEAAHRRAGAVELAQRLIVTIRREVEMMEGEED